MFADELRSMGACNAAINAHGHQTREEAWESCTQGEWLLWFLEERGVDCSAAGFWCAELVRQAVLRVLPESPDKTRLAECLPIVDKETANAAGFAAAAAAAAAARFVWFAAASAAQSAAWSAAASAAWSAAWSAAQKQIADYVRANYTLPPRHDASSHL